MHAPPFNNNYDLIDTIGTDLLNTLKGGSWQDIVLKSGFEYTADQKLQAKEAFGAVWLRGGITNKNLVALDNNQIIGTLSNPIPVPPDNVLIGIGSTANGLGVGFISRNRDIYVRTGSTVASYYKFTGIAYLVD